MHPIYLATARHDFRAIPISVVVSDATHAWCVAGVAECLHHARESHDYHSQRGILSPYLE